MVKTKINSNNKMNKMLYGILLMTVLACSNINEVKSFNGFDTFTMTPTNSDVKNCSMSVECIFVNNKLSKLTYKANKDSIINVDTVYYANGEKYFARKGLKNYENDPSRNQLVKIRYLNNDAIREVVVVNVENKYYLDKVTDLKKDLTVNYLIFNQDDFINKPFDSIDELLKTGLDKIKIYSPKEVYEIVSYQYTSPCKVGLTWKHYNFNPKQNTFIEHTSPSPVFFSSAGECFYIDSLREF